jgi:hypothetical protein
MHAELVARVAQLSDGDLLCQTSMVAARERESTVELVGYLAELDARKLYVAEGYGSLFAYCTGPLRLAERAAYNRIEAARLSRRFSVVLDLLAEGSLNLSTLRLLAPHLRPDNFETLVSRARHRSKRKVEALVAELAPQPDISASVRKLPERRALTASPHEPSLSEAHGAITAAPSIVWASTSPSQGGAETDSRSSTISAVESLGPAVGAAPTARPVIAPLSPDRYRMQFTMSAPTHRKLRQAQELLRREIPDGDPDAIIGKALAVLLEDVARRKLAVTAKPRPGCRPSPGSRHVPAHVKRAVWLRDGAQCAFVSARGRRCTERVFLEFHHREPYALGGEATAANISLRCRAHNEYEARLVFGTTPSGGHTPARVIGRSPVIERSLVKAHGAAGPSVNSPRGEFQTAGQAPS